MRVRADMPVDRVPRGRGWAVAVLGMIILALGFGVAEVFDASHPSGYRGAHMNPADWVYPTDDVRTWLIVIGCETLFACRILAARTRSSIGTRALMLGAAMFTGLWVMLPMAMHASSPPIDHLVFLFFASIFLGLFAVGSMVVHYLVRGRGCS